MFPVNPHETLFNDLNPADADYYVSLLKPHHIGGLSAESTYSTYEDFPATFVLCEKDNAIPIHLQERIIKQASQTAKDLKVIRISSGHSPFLSTPETIVGILKTVAEETA